jgi:enoyl-CoA hydratase/carnithine racemase
MAKRRVGDDRRAALTHANHLFVLLRTLFFRQPDGMKTVRSERVGRAMIVTLDRPDVHNAVSSPMIRELEAVMRSAGDDDATDIVVITGAGPSFCAGADLKERLSMSADEARSFLRQLGECFSLIDQLDKITVAAIAGRALGGGLELALACDLRIAQDGAEFAMPETQLAIIPGAGGTQRLPRAIGAPRAKEMCLFGRRLGVNEALSIGLISKIVARDQPLLPATLQWLGPLFDGPQRAFRAALKAIDACQQVPLAEGLAIEQQLYAPLLETADRHEALKAFAEKRKPHYTGK